ncbi:MAG: RNA polymerase sigma factor [Thermoanaerobaculia bacterium]
MRIFPEDKAFVARLLTGDETAYGELFEVHAQKVYRFALARVGDPDAAEELAQSSLAKAIPKLAQFRGEASLLTWLCAFCRFEILAFRREQRTREVEVELADDLPAVERTLDLIGASHVEPPEAQLLRKEVAHVVRVLLDRLPGRYGDVLEWKYLEDLSVSDIAERLHVTRTAAQSTLARARQAFRSGFSEIAAATTESQSG